MRSSQGQAAPQQPEGMPGAPLSHRLPVLAQLTRGFDDAQQQQGSYAFLTMPEAMLVVDTAAARGLRLEYCGADPASSEPSEQKLWHTARSLCALTASNAAVLWRKQPSNYTRFREVVWRASQGPNALPLEPQRAPTAFLTRMMEEGRQFEGPMLTLLASRFSLKLRRCGLFAQRYDKELMLGATPDALCLSDLRIGQRTWLGSQNYPIPVEIKMRKTGLPLEERIPLHFLAQVLLQMFVISADTGLFVQGRLLVDSPGRRKVEYRMFVVEMTAEDWRGLELDQLLAEFKEEVTVARNNPVWWRRQPTRAFTRPGSLAKLVEISENTDYLEQEQIPWVPAALF